MITLTFLAQELVAEAQRKIGKQFSSTDPQRLKEAVNKQLQTLVDVVVAEIIRTRKIKENIKQLFWEGVELDFDLVDSLWELPQIAPEKLWNRDHDEELPALMSQVMSTSFTVVPDGIKSVISHLFHCEKLPLAQVAGLLQESQENSMIKRGMSLKFQFSILQFMARRKALDLP